MNHTKRVEQHGPTIAMILVEVVTEVDNTTVGAAFDEGDGLFETVVDGVRRPGASRGAGVRRHD